MVFIAIYDKKGLNYLLKGIQNRIRLELGNNLQELTMFNLASGCKLSICDFIKPKVLDIAHGANVQSRAILINQKTGSSVQFELPPKTRDSLQELTAQKSLRSSDYLFGSRVNKVFI